MIRRLRWRFILINLLLVGLVLTVVLVLLLVSNAQRLENQSTPPSTWYSAARTAKIHPALKSACLAWRAERQATSATPP